MIRLYAFKGNISCIEMYVEKISRMSLQLLIKTNTEIESLPIQQKKKKTAKVQSCTGRSSCYQKLDFS